MKQFNMVHTHTHGLKTKYWKIFLKINKQISREKKIGKNNQINKIYLKFAFSHEFVWTLTKLAKHSHH